jgi:hypothetical protein
VFVNCTFKGAQPIDVVVLKEAAGDWAIKPLQTKIAHPSRMSLNCNEKLAFLVSIISLV